MRKKAIALLAIVGLMALMLPTFALAVGDDQIITGNPVVALAITAPTDNLAIPFAIGDNEDADSDSDNTVNCKSNVIYNVKINCDLDATKTTAFMWEWTGAAYTGTKKLQTAMSMKEHSGGSYAAITGAAVDINGFTSKTRTPNVGTNTYVDYKQPVDYGDERLSSTVYRHLLTYTIVGPV